MVAAPAAVTAVVYAPDTTPPSLQVTVANPGQILAGAQTLMRVEDDGAQYVIRPGAGQVIDPSAASAVIADYEAPQGEMVTYRTSASDATTGALPDLGDVWLINPAKPGLSVPIMVGIDDTRTASLDAEVIVIRGRATPIVATTTPRQADTGKITVRTNTSGEQQALKALLADGSPLRLSGHPGIDLPRWVQFGDVARSRVAQWCGDTRRTFELPFWEVDRPTVLMRTGPTRIRDIGRPINSLLGSFSDGTPP